MSVADKFNPPIFATADSHFPSMDITNIDALALQNEVNLLRKEINTIKDSRNADNETLVEIKKNAHGNEKCQCQIFYLFFFLFLF